MKQKKLGTNIIIFLVAEKKSGVHPEPILLNLTYSKNNNKKICWKKTVAHSGFHWEKSIPACA